MACMLYSLVLDVDSDTLICLFHSSWNNSPLMNTIQTVVTDRHFATAEHIIAVRTKYTVAQYINTDARLSLGIPHSIITLPMSASYQGHKYVIN